jgi:hypothetical protein
MAEELREQMAPILQQLADALAEALPEGWTKASMRVEAQSLGREVGLSYCIRSKQHEEELLEITEDIFQVTRRLHIMCELVGQPWSALVFGIEKVGEGWRFSTDFEGSAVIDRATTEALAGSADTHTKSRRKPWWKFW